MYLYSIYIVFTLKYFKFNYFKIKRNSKRLHLRRLKIITQFINNSISISIYYYFIKFIRIHMGKIYLIIITRYQVNHMEF